MQGYTQDKQAVVQHKDAERQTRRLGGRRTGQADCLRQEGWTEHQLGRTGGRQAGRGAGRQVGRTESQMGWTRKQVQKIGGR